MKNYDNPLNQTRSPAKKQIGSKHVKLLWGRAAERCAMCRKPLTANSREVGTNSYVLGEQAHIAGEKPDAARYDATLSETYVNSYANLILLCKNDHGEVDKNRVDWAAADLHQLKQDHEAWVRERFDEKGTMYRERDLRTIERIMKEIYTKEVFRIYEDLPRRIFFRDLYFHEQFVEVVGAPSFRLFDSAANDVVLRVLESWGRCYEHLGQYRMAGDRLLFSNDGDAPLSESQQGPWSEIEQASEDFIHAMDDLIGIVKTRFEEVDIFETDRIAIENWRRSSLF